MSVRSYAVWLFLKSHLCQTTYSNLIGVGLGWVEIIVVKLYRALNKTILIGTIFISMFMKFLSSLLGKF